MIIVFGSQGMLGRAVVSVLSSNQSLTVKAMTRLDFDISECNEKSLEAIINMITTSDSSYRAVINCAGCIPQRDGLNELDFFKINSFFPQILARVCNRLRIPCVHITTDCVFSGKMNNSGYRENSTHDAETVYGVSKSMGEPATASVIRTSIIGEEGSNKKSLLEWVLSNPPEKEIGGYTNHLWNGVTCIQLAGIIEHMIIHRQYWMGVRHIFSPREVSKFELIQMIVEIYNLPNTVIPVATLDACDRTLSTSYYTGWMGVVIPDIKEQILQQKLYWHYNH